MKVQLRHKNTDELMTAPVGFSWTTLIFGPFPALLRGDFKWAAGMFATVFFVAFIIGPIAILGWVPFAWIYNGEHIKERIRKGWRIENVHGGSVEEVAAQLERSPENISI